MPPDTHNAYVEAAAVTWIADSSSSVISDTRLLIVDTDALTTVRVSTLAKALKGYPGLTAEEVRSWLNALLLINWRMQQEKQQQQQYEQQQQQQDGASVAPRSSDERQLLSEDTTQLHELLANHLAMHLAAASRATEGCEPLMLDCLARQLLLATVIEAQLETEADAVAAAAAASQPSSAAAAAPASESSRAVAAAAASQPGSAAAAASLPSSAASGAKEAETAEEQYLPRLMFELLCRITEVLSRSGGLCCDDEVVGEASKL
jgi:hypothetical protein